MRMAGHAPWHAEWVPSPRRVRVVFNGETLADSRRVMLLRQHGFLPVYYFPREDVRTDLLEPSDYVTDSPYKGRASYWTVRVGDRRAEASAWSYLDPKPGSPDTRGYLSFDVHMDLLEPSSTYTMCPYKGRAAYYSARIGGELHADVAWYYPCPVRDVARIENHLSFWNERFAIELDGEPQPTPVARPGGD